MADRWLQCPSDTADRLVQDQHVVPIDDVIGHELTRSCWCHPFIEVSPCECHASVIHRSADGREYNETPKPKYPPASRH